ncbi:transglutaminase family protein [Beijerinckia indica]|uniref:Transglutaminase domain protein n=1 Tax=Beijerinckia indica subsp. indica (strain ATCC 9039 / DSM 1715 / NCIMB 8712) TaxID=395963 RepID=B2ICY6_BEII9|nr:transglutaminase family protein [Beijerinckia indica]ACB96840.1 transglutaminase domain protein [Beijerinckia indica subsp. indica ATCC 9039]
MIYTIRHVTTYTYGSSVTFAHCELRLLPQDGAGQMVYLTDLLIDPAPARIVERRCFFGNRLTSMTIDTAHRALRVEARSTVEVLRDLPPAENLTRDWEEIREDAFDSDTLAPESPAHFMHPSRFVPQFKPATAYARESFGPGRPILAGAVELMQRIRADFRYDPKATIVSTPLSEAFEKRRGVCQDFAHIMIAGLRGIGLPAAYISGYIRTIPPPGKPRLEGADAMHAWVAVWCGEEWGWIGLDPTNALMIGDDHVVLAKGRDYADISPVAGIILGSREQDVDVSVDVVPQV